MNDRQIFQPEFHPSFIDAEVLKTFPSDWELMINGDKLLIAEAREYSFIRPWNDFKCSKCQQGVKVQECIFPDTPFDNSFIDCFNKNKKQIYGKFYKNGVFNIESGSLRELDFTKITCLAEYPYGTLWYFAKQEFGTIIKTCDCD